MAEIIKWPVVLVCPGEEELTLLADLSARRDARIVAVVDPEGFSIGASLAEVMGLRVIKDLAELEPGSATYLVHPPLDDQVAPIVDQAEDFGLKAVSAREFPRIMAGPNLTDPRFHADPEAGPRFTPGIFTGKSSTDRTDFDLLEMETAAIHRTLSRIEEALDREGLLRWLLGLATRATGAGSGSIMLFDRALRRTVRGLRLRAEPAHRAPHPGPAGRGHRRPGGRARQGRVHHRQPAPRRQARPVGHLRGHLRAHRLGRASLLGVLNISANEGEGKLAGNALATIESLTHRFGMILDRFLRLQTVRDGELFRYMEDEFTRDTGSPEAVAATLCTWAEDLKRRRRRRPRVHRRPDQRRRSVRGRSRRKPNTNPRRCRKRPRS